MVAAALLSSAKDDWRTPGPVLERVRKVGPIGLDPCTARDNPTRARIAFFRRGLELPWQGHGLVYVNPPYGRELPAWVTKVVEESWAGSEIILLVPARTDTRWWGQAYAASASVALWRGRLTFEGAPAPAPFPSCLFYLGPRPHGFDHAFEDKAHIIAGGKS